MEPIDDPISDAVVERMAARLHEYFRESWRLNPPLRTPNCDVEFADLPHRLKQTLLHVATRLLTDR